MKNTLEAHIKFTLTCFGTQRNRPQGVSIWS